MIYALVLILTLKPALTPALIPVSPVPMAVSAILMSTLKVVSHSQTTFSSFIFGREEKGSGTPTIEKPVLASTATRGG